ncbi:unnamed protein product [Caenorhabditis auriculariae]|uniref:Uncharacterized protein n=1 Tax=Caenorhabditis auriculariae TaxID=2777116 RepID=A0A8S1H5K1_9PELO|nr:unnamed protein product [Caenorhabditis auriculariae]
MESRNEKNQEEWLSLQLRLESHSENRLFLRKEVKKAKSLCDKILMSIGVPKVDHEMMRAGLGEGDVRNRDDRGFVFEDNSNDGESQPKPQHRPEPKAMIYTKTIREKQADLKKELQIYRDELHAAIKIMHCSERKSKKKNEVKETGIHYSQSEMKSTKAWGSMLARVLVERQNFAKQFYVNNSLKVKREFREGIRKTNELTEIVEKYEKDDAIADQVSRSEEPMHGMSLRKTSWRAETEESMAGGERRHCHVFGVPSQP